jgi:osmotically-inducible protein OsmY
VCDQLALDERVDAREVDVQVVDSKVRLRGNVATRAEKRVAESIADAIMGVTDVDNDLHVGLQPPVSRTGTSQSPLPAEQM